MTWTGNSPNRIRGRKWMAIRAEVLREEPICRECKRLGTVSKDSIAVICDHIVSLADGGKDERSNYQALCKRHHDLKTAAESARAQGRAAPKPRGGDETGWPSDPAHPWNATRPGAGLSTAKGESIGKPAGLHGRNANAKKGPPS